MLKRSKYLVLTADFLVPLTIILLAFALYFVAFHTKLFTLSKITCQLDYEPCTNEPILAELDKYLGHNLLSLDQVELESRLLSGDFMIRAVEQHRLFPSTLEVTLLSTYPVVALQQDDRPFEWITLDQNLRVIAHRDSDPNVPTVTLTSTPPFQLGKKIDDQEIEDTLRLALEISSELISVKKIHLLSDYTVSLELTSGHTALLTTNQDQLAQLHTLESLLADPAILNTYKTIDVRRSQPVLK